MGSVKDSHGRFARGLAINPAALRQARLAAQLTRAEVSKGIVSPQALYQFESGRARPRQAVLHAIADRLDVPIETLLARAHDPREQSMRELEERRRWDELERLASAVLADPNVTPRIQAVALLFRGRAIHQLAPAEALPILRLARGQLAQVGEPWLAAEARDWEAACLYHLQDPAALDIGRDALGRYRMLTDRDPCVEARMLEHIGTYLLQRQEVREALEYYYKAIDTAGRVLDLARLANIYHGMASGCSRLGETGKALEYFERAVHLSRTHHDVKGAVTVGLARLENDYGDLLVQTGRWERAEEVLQAAIANFEAAGVETGKNAALLGMGDLRRRQGRLDEAVRWTSQAVKLAERLGERVSLARGCEQLGELKAAEGDYQSCAANFRRALDIYARADLPERRAEALERYRRICEHQAGQRQGS